MSRRSPADPGSRQDRRLAAVPWRQPGNVPRYVKRGRRVRRIVFLDVDGVLNSIERYARTGYRGGPPVAGQYPTVERVNWDPACVARVRRIVELTGAELVITSTWRDGMTPAQFRDAFALYGWEDAPVAGVTPTHAPESFVDIVRGREVAMWLAANVGQECVYVCIDDVDDYLDGQPFVRTDERVGITNAEVETVLAALAGA
jgi:hypothetical protein